MEVLFPAMDFLKSLLLIFIRAELLYNVGFVSAVQQSESAIRIYVPPLFWISFPFVVVVARSLGRV